MNPLLLMLLSQRHAVLAITRMVRLVHTPGASVSARHLLPRGSGPRPQSVRYRTDQPHYSAFLSCYNPQVLNAPGCGGFVERLSEVNRPSRRHRNLRGIPQLPSFKYVGDTNFVVPAKAGTHFDLVEHGFPLSRE